MVSAVKAASIAVEQACITSSEAVLLRIERKRLYDLTAFDEEQRVQMVGVP